MYLIRGIQNIDYFISKHKEVDLIATIGNFDGLHLGHQKVISEEDKIRNLRIKYENQLTELSTLQSIEDQLEDISTFSMVPSNPGKFVERFKAET